MADEIYDKILYDDAVHIPMASVAPDVLTLTFNGLSKAYRVCGYRAGWLVVTGPLERAQDYLEGITLLARCGCAPTCRRRTRSRWRSAATSRSRS